MKSGWELWGKKYNQGGFFSTFSRHMLEQHNTALEPLQPRSWDLWQQLLLKSQTFSSRGFLTWTTRDVLFSCQLQKMHVSQEISRGSASDECHMLQQYRSLSSSIFTTKWGNFQFLLSPRNSSHLHLASKLIFPILLQFIWYNCNSPFLMHLEITLFCW